MTIRCLRSRIRRPSRRRITWLTVAVLAGLTLLAVMPALAQEGWTPGDMTSIRGRLEFSSPPGAFYPDLARPLLITLLRAGTSTPVALTTLSDPDTGTFVIPSVYPEVYTVCVEGNAAAGCRSVRHCQDVVVQPKPAITEIVVPFDEPHILIPLVRND